MLVVRLKIHSNITPISDARASSTEANYLNRHPRHMEDFKRRRSVCRLCVSFAWPLSLWTRSQYRFIERVQEKKKFSILVLNCDNAEAIIRSPLHREVASNSRQRRRHPRRPRLTRAEKDYSKWTDVDLFAWCATPVTTISARISLFWFSFSLSLSFYPRRNEKALPCKLARAWRKRMREHRVHRPTQGRGNTAFLLSLGPPFFVSLIPRISQLLRGEFWRLWCESWYLGLKVWLG